MIYQPIPGLEIPEMDMEAMKASLRILCLETHRYLLGISDDSRISDPELLAKIDLFEKTYISFSPTDKPIVNEDALQKFCEFILQNITFITNNDLNNTVERSLEDEPDSLDFFISERKRELSDFDSIDSGSSNEYMIKLARRKAQESGKKINILSSRDYDEDVKVIKIIDDASYSGTQLASFISELLREIKNDEVKIIIYVAGITERAKMVIRDILQGRSNVKLLIKSEITIRSLYDLTEGHPEFECLFSAYSIGFDYNSNKDSPDFNQHNLKITAFKHLDSRTLTRTELTTPDPMSFPYSVSELFEYKKPAERFPKVSSSKL